MTDDTTPRPITMQEWERVQRGAQPEIEWFMLEAAYISDWWEPTEEDIKHFHYILSLDIDTNLITSFMSKLGRHGGRRVHKSFWAAASVRWKVKSDHKNSLERRALAERKRKWGITDQDGPMFDEEVWA